MQNIFLTFSKRILIYFYITFISFFLYIYFHIFSVPPPPPKIFNDRGEHIESRAGPFEEGGDLHLICVVMGGMYN